MSRQAKLLMNNKPGRTASYGMVLEELMNSRGQSMGFLSGKAESPQKKSPNSPVTKSASATTTGVASSAAQEQQPTSAVAVADSITASRSNDF
jgi:hypothetical protein